MELIEVYIQEVTRRLPEKMRRDIAMELRSNIEDMLPDDYSKDDVKQELKNSGIHRYLQHSIKIDQCSSLVLSFTIPILRL